MLASNHLDRNCIVDVNVIWGPLTLRYLTLQAEGLVNHQSVRDPSGQRACKLQQAGFICCSGTGAITKELNMSLGEICGFLRHSLNRSSWHEECLSG